MIFNIMKEERLEISFIRTTLSKLSLEEQSLIKNAKDSSNNAYAPYSGFLVGASVLLDNGKIILQSKIKISIDAEPEIRTELVKNYKEQIKSGEYKIDPDEVASKMIYDSLEEDLA